jgi:hypothetical protein
MSNRKKWAHWKKPKPDKYWWAKQYSLGIAFIILGGFLLLSGVSGLKDHMLWFQHFDFAFGRPVTGLTVSLVLIGGAFILGGIFSFIEPGIK